MQQSDYDIDEKGQYLVQVQDEGSKRTHTYSNPFHQSTILKQLIFEGKDTYKLNSLGLGSVSCIVQ